MTLTVGSLFSGIGGIDLGLERAGMKVLWQVEIDPWCRAVLAKHWPSVDRYEDVREVHGRGACRIGGCKNCLPAVDVIAGGFPCQDISIAGRAAGIRGSRSGLWSEFARLIGGLRPRYVLVENVPALVHRGLDVVLGDLAARGYDAEWDCIPAVAVGAPHRRDRIWIVAYRAELSRALADADYGGSRDSLQAGRDAARNGGTDVADANGGRRQQRDAQVGRVPVAHSSGAGGRGDNWWIVEPPVGRVAHGIPGRVDRLRGLGNAVVPQVVEWIGRRIVEADAAMTEPLAGEAR